MNRTKKLIIGGIVAAVATFGLAASAGATTTPSDGGLQPDGSYVECVDNNANFQNFLLAPQNGAHACGAGWSTIHFNAVGPKGATGAAGSTGATGATGAAGATGATGPAGTNGTNGTNAQALPYGIALVNVSRGGAAATTWGTYSTTIGSPVGDTASGTFRMSCSAAKAPCVITAQAYATVAGIKVYERLDISRQDTNNVPTGNCEYADGADNNGSSSGVLSTTAATPTALTLGIGGTLDCGSAQTYPVNGIASEIDVPAGFYDIAATFTFKAS